MSRAYLNFEDMADGTFRMMLVCADGDGRPCGYRDGSASHQHARIALKILDEWLTRTADPDEKTINPSTDIIVPDGKGNLLCPLCGEVNQKAMRAAVKADG